jgi:hypothetical protein
VLVDLAAEFLAAAGRDIDLVEVSAGLVLDFDRSCALVALFEPQLPGEKEAPGEV